MRTIKLLLRKEFKQIFRNRTIIAMVTAVPIVQLAILPFAADFEFKNLNIAIVDHDHSSWSQKLISKIPSSGYFRLTEYEPSFAKALSNVEKNEADIVLEIPQGFERNLIRENEQHLFIAANAINGAKAGLGTAYLTSILMDFNRNIRIELMHPNTINHQPILETTFSNWYNPALSYKVLMVPGILAILVTLIGGFLSVLNIVKEKEVGTIEQINVTPVKKHHFILGKLIPFWILGNVVFTLGLAVSWLVYGIVPTGSILLLYAFVAVFLLAILGLGLLVSTWCETQQQAMFMMFFFMMVFILLSGLFIPIDTMPEWARVVTRFNPVSYLITVMRMVMLKGSSLADVLPQLEIIAAFAFILNMFAILNYKKAS